MLVVLVLGALRTAITPLGRRDTVRATLAARPTGVPTVIMLATLAPPTKSLGLVTEADKLKRGVGTTTVRLVDPVTVGLVPVTMMGYTPGTVEAVGFKVSWLVVFVVAALNAPVMPAGSPETARDTLLLKLFWGITLSVEATFVPPTKAVRLVTDEARLKKGVGMLKVNLVVAEKLPEVASSVTG